MGDEKATAGDEVEVRLTFSRKTLSLLEDLAEKGVYGIGVSGVAEGFVYRGLQESARGSRALDMLDDIEATMLAEGALELLDKAGALRLDGAWWAKTVKALAKQFMGDLADPGKEAEYEEGSRDARG